MTTFPGRQKERKMSNNREREKGMSNNRIMMSKA